MIMMHSNSLELGRVALVIIDMQEAFRTRIPDFTETAERIGVMVQGAKLLDVPIIVTEQYPKGLKHTAAEIKAALPADLEIIEKTTFSSCGVKPFEAKLEKTGRKQLLVAGIEAHICVNQTVHDLLARGYQVHLLYDCISSRSPQNKQVGLEKMQLSGAIPCSVETALFELLRDAKHEQFKAVQNLVK